MSRPLAGQGLAAAVRRRRDLPADSGKRARHRCLRHPADVHARRPPSHGTAVDDRRAEAVLSTTHHGSVTLLWVRQTGSEEHTAELQSHSDIVCRLLLGKKKKISHTGVAATCADTHGDITTA